MEEKPFHYFNIDNLNGDLTHEHGNYTARVGMLGDLSLETVCSGMRDVVRNQGRIDIISFELPPVLIEKIKLSASEKGFPLKLPDVGHMSLLLNYAVDRMKMPTFITQIGNIDETVCSIRNYMGSTNRSMLYQMCQESNETQLREALENQGFTID